MRYRRNAVTFIFILLYGTIASAQPEKLKGTWISSELEMVEILHTGRNEFNYLSNLELEENFFYLFIYGDTLSFQSIYTSSSTNHEVEYVDRYDLKIVSSNDSLLVLEPVSDFSKAFFLKASFLERTTLTLKKKDYLIDKSIKFERLVYHASDGGSTPNISIQIDSTRNLYVHFRIPSSDRMRRTGVYSAVLDEDTYNKLIFQLQNAQIRALRFGNFKGADSPIITLIIYYNNTRNYLRSIVPNRIARDLLDYIQLQLANYPGLRPASGIQELEWP